MVGIDTVDGRNRANQLRLVIYFTPLFAGFYASKVFRKVAENHNQWQYCRSIPSFGSSTWSTVCRSNLVSFNVGFRRVKSHMLGEVVGPTFGKLYIKQEICIFLTLAIQSLMDVVSPS